MKKRKLQTGESATLESEMIENEEKTTQYFGLLPTEMKMEILLFVICEMKKDWKRNWNNISLISKHWNSIAWIFLQRLPESKKRSLFGKACSDGDFHFINKFLIQDITFDPSFHNNASIIGACRWGRSAVVNLLLLDKRVDPSTDNNYVIKWASQFEFTSIVKLLLQDERVDPSVAIGEAIGGENIDIIKLLLQDERVDPDTRNYAMKFAEKMDIDLF